MSRDERQRLDDPRFEARQYEQAMLTATRKVWQRRHAELEAGVTKARHRWQLYRDAGSEAALAVTEKRRERLAEALSTPEPYFRRVDLAMPEGLASYYLSRRLHWDDSAAPDGVEILNWTAPVAQQLLGPPPEAVRLGEEGHATVEMVRDLYLNVDTVEAVEDLYNLQRPELAHAWADVLLARLRQRHGGAMRDILETIARQQRDVVFTDADTLIVEGGPGTGKTQVGQLRVARMVAERVAAHPERPVSPEEFLVLSPNRPLIHYVAPLLSQDFGVREIPHRTVKEWLLEAAGVAPVAVQPGRAPGRLAEGFLEQLEAEIAGWTAEQFWACMHRMPTRWQGFPVTPDMVMEAWRTAREAALAAVGKTFLEGIASGVEQARVRQLGRKDYEEAEHQRWKRSLAEWVEKHAATWWPPFDHLRFYQQMLDRTDGPSTITLDDLPALAWLRWRAHGSPAAAMRVRHVVLDEAQTVPPLVLRVLRLWYPQARWTLVGDLDQRTDGYMLADWGKLEALGFTGIVRKSLTTSYRITPPVAAFLNHLRQVFHRRAAPLEAVNRGAPAVMATMAPTDEEASRIVARWCRQQALDGRYAVLAPTADRAEWWQAALQQVGVALPLVTPEDPLPEGGMVTSLEAARGLEFDGVCIVDADPTHFPATPDGARHLFLLASRACEALCCVAVGALSPLLAGAPISLAGPVEDTDARLPEESWEGQGSVRETAWGWQWPRDAHGRFLRGPAVGMDEDRYDDEADP